MLPSIRAQPSLDSSLNVSSAILRHRILKRHLLSPSEYQSPKLQEFRLETTDHPIELTHKKFSGTERVEDKPLVLDGFSLLENMGITLPDDAIFGELSGKKFTNVVETDLCFFTQLLYLDVSENYLQMAHFGNLPRLQELRLACNDIRDIDRHDLRGPDQLDRFYSLQSLDLSYNCLTISSILSLDCLPCLRDLNLCGNQLSELPPDMGTFHQLEKILLENNRFESSTVFISLCQIPNLREVSLAYNFLCDIPQEACELGCFRLLETLDIAFNYFGSDTNVEAILNLSRLKSLLLYGNPLLGPTGEDPHFIYIEDLAISATEARGVGRGNETSTRSYPIEVSALIGVG